MNLHLNKKIFSNILMATSNSMKVKLEFVEKDYWVTLILKNLALSDYAEEVVFKGGTSLSKGYNLIDRFSEDIDIAMIKGDSYTGNQLKKKIREIEKVITSDLKEIEIAGISSKGSKFRKSVFEYSSEDPKNQSHKIILEVNSFANLIQFQKLSIKSFIAEFLIQNGNELYIEEYNLQPFTINVLNKEQTLLEKLISLIRFSYDKNHIESISGKIRHFYDLYFLVQDIECKKFLDSDSFKDEFVKVINHDKEIFKEPRDWAKKSINESPLIDDFDNLWKILSKKYYEELTAFAYNEIPNPEDVKKNFKKLINRIV